MKKLIATLSISLAMSGCASEIDVKPAQSDDGKCVQERTQKFLGISFGRSQYVINC